MVGSRPPRATATSKPAARARAAIAARSALLASATSSAWSGLAGSGGRAGGGARSPGQLADHPPVILLAGLQPPFGEGEAAARQREPGVGLGDVGAGQVADLEAVAGRLQIGAEDADLILVELDDRTVANHVHIGGDRLGEDVALGRAQVGAAGLDAGVGGADRVADPAAGEERQAGGGADAEVAAVGAGDIGGHDVLVEPRRRRELRPAGGAGDVDALVGRAQRLALGHQRRIGGVGLDQRFAQRLGRPGRRRRRRRRAPPSRA